jgi:hypothetical protein
MKSFNNKTDTYTSYMPVNKILFFPYNPQNEVENVRKKRRSREKG